VGDLAARSVTRGQSDGARHRYDITCELHARRRARGWPVGARHRYGIARGLPARRCAACLRVQHTARAMSCRSPVASIQRACAMTVYAPSSSSIDDGNVTSFEPLSVDVSAAVAQPSTCARWEAGGASLVCFARSPREAAHPNASRALACRRRTACRSRHGVDRSACSRAGSPRAAAELAECAW
jgi:hypothetical protein